MFFACSACYLLSALTLKTLDVPERSPGAAGETFGAIVRGLRYCFSEKSIRRAVLTLSVVDCGTVSVNIAFYAYAFDTLKVTSAYWGLLLSVLYGMGIFAMLFLLRRQKALTRNAFATADLCIILMALAWSFYALTRNTQALLAGAAVEGFFTSLGTTLLVTTMLKSSRQDYTARVTGVRDMCSYASKLIGIGLTYGLMSLCGTESVFFTGAAVLLLSVAVRTIRPIPNLGGDGRLKGERRYLK